MTKHVEAALAKIQIFFEQAGARIDALKVGEKIPATTLADDIAKLHNLKGPQLYPVLKWYFDTRADVSLDGDIVVKKGATGGIEKIK